MTRLRAGVIGAGSWAVASHLPNLLARPEVEVVGICRHGAAQLAAVADRFGIGFATEDPDALLAQDLDLVVVSSPSAFHAEQARAAVASGAHVLVEKPFTLDPADAWDLVDRAAAADRHLVVAYGFNHLPLTLAAAELLATHGIGTVETVQVTMSTDTRALLSAVGAYPKAAVGVAPDTATWTDPQLSGGGYAQAQLSHALGLALGLTGLRGATVQAAMSAPGGAPVELHAQLLLTFDGGAIGTVSGSSAHPGFQGGRDQLQVRLVGSEGHLDLAYESDTVELHRADTGRHTLPVPARAGSYHCDGPPNTLVDLALGTTTVNRSPGELGARTTEILAAAYRSAATGTPIRIEAHADAPPVAPPPGGSSSERIGGRAQ